MVTFEGTAVVDQLGPEAQVFCEREGLAPYLARAVGLIHEHFPEVQEMKVELVWDPDTDNDKWLSITATVPLTVAEIIARDNALLDRWLIELPWPKGDKIVHIVETV